MENATIKFEEWCIVELFGHQKIAGLVSEQNLGGQNFIRIDVPATEFEKEFTKLFHSNAIYAITPTTEIMAKACAIEIGKKPINLYVDNELMEKMKKIYNGSEFKQLSQKLDSDDLF